MHILIADDHSLFRDGLRRLLVQLADDTTIREAGTFPDALDRCEDEAFDLVLLDLGLPGWTGFGDLTAIHDRQPRTRIVIISGSERRADLLSALEHGSAGFVPKSSSASVLLGALQVVLAGGVYVPAQAVRGDLSRAVGDIADDSLTNPTVAGGGSMTPRQREVLARLREGKSNKAIALELGLTEGTVKVHVTAILRLLGVRNRTQAALTLQGL